MSDLVKYLLHFAYYIAWFLGVFNFEVDFERRLAKVTARTSWYAALMNVLTISSLPTLSISTMLQSFVSGSGELHEYIFGLMLGGHVLCVTVTLIMRWWQRQQVIRIMNSFMRLANRRPRVIRMWRRAIIAKFCSLVLMELTAIVMAFFVLWNSLTLRILLNILVMFVLMAMNNVIISHYYFALLNIHGHYILLNEELRLLLAEASSLAAERGRGVFAIKCCALADRIESIASRQTQLQGLAQQIAGIFGLQTLFISISVYMTSVCVIYFAFSQLPGTTISLTWKNWRLTTTLFFEFVFYFLDTFITINMMCSVLTVHAEMMTILSQSSVLTSGLDKRLLTAVESFKLQLAWNPLRISVLGLYHMEKSRALALISSAVGSSVVLVQYDLQNS